MREHAGEVQRVGMIGRHLEDPASRPPRASASWLVLLQEDRDPTASSSVIRGRLLDGIAYSAVLHAVLNIGSSSMTWT